MKIKRALAVVAISCVLASAIRPGVAEDALPALRPTLSLDDTFVSAQCGSSAALYSAAGVRVWVTRRGSIQHEDPLRPLSRESLIVLQVHVNGRSATAFGPDFDNLRQGGSPQTLEGAYGNPIVWEPEPTERPRSIRVVAENGAVLLGPLAFQSCGDAPVVSSPKASSRPAAANRTNPPSRSSPAAPTEAPRPRLSLPQGAIR